MRSQGGNARPARVPTFPFVTSSHLDSLATAEPAHVEADDPTVLDVVTAAGVDASDALAVAGALAAASTHPVAVAVAAHAAEQVPFWPAMMHLTRIDELGVGGDTGAREALIGSPALLAAHGIALPDELTAAVVGAAIEARTPLVLAWNGRARAVLVVGEAVAEPAPPAAEPARHNRAWTVLTLLATIAVVTGLLCRTGTLVENGVPAS